MVKANQFIAKTINQNRMIFWNPVQFRVLLIQVPLGLINE